MESVVLVLHLIFALAIISLVLLQRSEGGGLGIGGGGGGLGGLATAKGTASALTKMTAICAAGFFATSLTLGVLASNNSQQNIGLLENVDPAQIEAQLPTSDDNEAQSGFEYIPPSEIKRELAPSADIPAPAVEIPEAPTEVLEENTEDSNIQQTLQPETEEPSAPVE
ncbi:MAG: preprotein translocase subunit SecG [Alphaproteobacteria bacterium]|nr:preprotein translocase subunit SecG [Alphaproteobacteria bacterium]